MAGVRYRSSPELRRQYFQKQGGLCYVCLQPTEFSKGVLDHDHESGEIRGFACQSCNVLLSKWDVWTLKFVGKHNLGHSIWGYGIVDILTEDTLSHESDWMEVNRLL